MPYMQHYSETNQRKMTFGLSYREVRESERSRIWDPTAEVLPIKLEVCEETVGGFVNVLFLYQCSRDQGHNR